MSQPKDDSISNNRDDNLNCEPERGAEEAATALLAGGANPHHIDSEGLTARDWAERSGHKALAERLRGANVD